MITVVSNRLPRFPVLVRLPPEWPRDGVLVNGAARGGIATIGRLGDEWFLRLLGKARTALGEEAYAAAWAAGSALSLDEAIAELTALAGTVMAPDFGHRSAPGNLTSREREILRLLVDGRSDKEIAAALRISPRTVSKHVASIRDKLNAPSRTAAATLAVRDGRV